MAISWLQFVSEKGFSVKYEYGLKFFSTMASSTESRARSTKGISIEFKIKSKFGVL